MKRDTAASDDDFGLGIRPWAPSATHRIIAAVFLFVTYLALAAPFALSVGAIEAG
jgi:hypothetical protein